MRTVPTVAVTSGSKIDGRKSRGNGDSFRHYSPKTPFVGSVYLSEEGLDSDCLDGSVAFAKAAQELRDDVGGAPRTLS